MSQGRKLVWAALLAVGLWQFVLLSIFGPHGTSITLWGGYLAPWLQRLAMIAPIVVVGVVTGCLLRRRPEQLAALVAAAAALPIALPEALPRSRGEATFSPWLGSIAVRLWATQRRRESAECRPHDKLAEPPLRDDLAEAAARRDAARRLWDLVLQLPPTYREAIVARATADSVGEAAENLGLPPGRYRTRLHRARLALRDLLCTRCPELVTELGYADR